MTAPPRATPDHQPPGGRAPARFNHQEPGGNGHAPQPPTADPERALLCAATWSPQALEDAVAAGVLGRTFNRPTHAATWNALRTLRAQDAPTDAAALHHELQRRGDKTSLDAAANLPDILTTGTLASSASYHAQQLVEQARARDGQTLALRLGQMYEQPNVDHAAIHALMQEHLEEEHGRGRNTATVRNIDEFLGGPDDQTYDWVVPGLIERHDRLMLTGPEGGGKSTFCRQFAVMAATGLHPFTGELIQPARVLYLDLENSERQSRRKLRPLRIAAGDQLDPDQLHIEVRPSGLDLLDTRDHAWLLGLVDATQPDILITGPIYRMASGDPTEEKTAKPVSQALDKARERGCAIILETHTPHATSGQRKRPLRPYGASLWLRWPEFGLHLADDGELEHWRGARDERDWPTLLRRGGAWPWTPVSDPGAVLWARIKQARHDFGQPMTVRDLEAVLGGSKSTIHRCLQSRRNEWDSVNEGTDE